jgi:hypothetical protein
MLKRIKGQMNAATILSVVALFFALGGGAYALKGKNKIDKNDLKANVVKSKHVAGNALGGADINEGSLALTDVYSAVVQNGEVVRQVPSSAGIEAQDEGDGLFEVDFNRDVTACVYMAGLGGPDDIPPNQGSIRWSREPGEPTKVNVETFDTADAFQDRNFHIVIVCP